MWKNPCVYGVWLARLRDDRYEMPAVSMKCKTCSQLLKQWGVGRLPIYCSSACRQKAYRLRKVLK